MIKKIPEKEMSFIVIVVRRGKIVEIEALREVVVIIQKEKQKTEEVEDQEPFRQIWQHIAL